MENEEKENVGANATTQESTGADKATDTKKKTLDELLAEDKELQSQYDTKVTNSLKTAKTNWEKELENKRAEAEKLAKMSEEEKRNLELQEAIKRANEAESKLNARDLEAETLKQAGSKGIPLELIQTLDFTKETADSINSKLEIFEKTYKAEREKAINEYSKEPSPRTGDSIENSKPEGQMTYEELCKLSKYKN